MFTLAVRRSLNVSEWAPIQDLVEALQTVLAGDISVMSP
jgi:hypothetical protein